ncbi:MAG: CCA tRNA nucleotidyltransferase [Bdellovibrionales bacterium]|nr:CCA tRNA nucleotidyltransferase [Bdellovibrionales bacterium]
MWTRIEKPLVIPADVRQVVSSLTDAGFESYIVGGAVRDSIRGVPVADFDVATQARPEEVEKIFSKVIEVGRSFGVMKVISEAGRPVEVATFRKDGDYADHRHPKSVQFSSVTEDASRRDFTVNALYYDVKTGQVLDEFGGLQDIKDKKIRAIGDPAKRFKEDSLRLIRAVRFAACFGFKIEDATQLAIQQSSTLIRKVSVERIRDELEKIFLGPNAKAAMIEIDQLKLLESVLPEVAAARIENRRAWDQTLRVLNYLPKVSEKAVDPQALPIPASIYWTWVLLPSMRLQAMDKREEAIRKVGARLRLSNEMIDQMVYFSRETAKFRDAFSMREATLLRWMRETDFPLLMQFHEVDAIAFDGNLSGLEFVRSIYPEAKRRFESKPLLTGDDLVKLGMNPGRQFTEILRAVEDLSLEGKLGTKEEALEYVLKQFVK